MATTEVVVRRVHLKYNNNRLGSIKAFIFLLLTRVKKVENEINLLLSVCRRIPYMLRTFVVL